MRRQHPDEDLMLDEVYDLDELLRRHAPVQTDPTEDLEFQLAAEAFDRLWRRARDKGCQRAYPN